jgi:hypothetical protein
MGQHSRASDGSGRFLRPLPKRPIFKRVILANQSLAVGFVTTCVRTIPPVLSCSWMLKVSIPLIDLPIQSNKVFPAYALHRHANQERNIQKLLATGVWIEEAHHSRCAILALPAFLILGPTWPMQWLPDSRIDYLIREGLCNRQYSLQRFGLRRNR